MSLKEKFQVVLNQKRQFKCPNGAGTIKPAAQPKTTATTPAPAKTKEDQFALVVANLKQRGCSKPRKLKTLKSTIASLFPKGLTDAELKALVLKLQSTGKVTVSENNVTYDL